MDFYERALELREETVRHRRWLHSNAEVGLDMPKTQAYVMEQLKKYGLEPRPCGHGVTAELGQKTGKTLLHRPSLRPRPPISRLPPYPWRLQRFPQQSGT